MSSDFPPQVEKIVDDYLDRLSMRLKGLSREDRQDFLNEWIGEITCISSRELSRGS